MKKKRIYSMWAKCLVVIIMVAAAVVAGISGSWIALGLRHGMGVEEIMNPVSYEYGDSVKNYLRWEGQEILESMGKRDQYCLNGTDYDDSATIDIRDVQAGVAKRDKNPDTEYSLKALEDFYNSDGLDKLQYLVDHADMYVDYPEDDIASAEVIEQDDMTDNTDQTEVLGSEAKVLRTDRAEVEQTVENDDGSEEAQYISFEVKCYGEVYNVLYNNGIEIENQYVRNISGGTLADYIQSHPDANQLFACYHDLISAACQLHDFLEMKEADTNARLYACNVDNGIVYTNVPEWKKMSLAQVKENYLSVFGDDNGGVYYCCDEKTSVKDTVTETKPILKDQYMTAMGDELLGSARENLAEGNYQFFIGLDTNYPLRGSESYQDMQIYQWYNQHQPFGTMNKVYLFFGALAVILVTLIIASCQTGHIPENDEIQPALMDRFPIEILIIMDICLWVLVIVLAGTSTIYYGVARDENVYYYIRSQYVNMCAGLTSAAVLAASITAWELKRYGRRIKAHRLGGSVIRSVGSCLKKAAGGIYRARKENEKLLFLYIGFLAIHFIFLLIAGVAGSNYMGFGAFCIIVILLAFDIFVLVRLFRAMSGRDEIKKGMEEISRGNLDYQIDTEHMSGDNREMAEELNRVRDGLKKAIETEMKSERLKTDLITNVSHDIKTPLTSIINYVDILKRENIQDERIAGYIGILDRKALRLKQLTEDLVEASKISSGNITLEMQNINLKQLIKQTNGEFEEKFAGKNLELICNLPESEMTISADGRRMFRVIENLYNNAAKYAMPNSRVYVTGELKKGKVIFSMKNMSESPLNFKADELLERFVRGDVSRSTEGSGLGLEIAKNLTVMQKGTFDLYLDGDLFKVTVTFDAV